jgi:hypothetical protein
VDPSAAFFQQSTAQEVVDDDCSRPYPFCLAYQLDHNVTAWGDRNDWLAEWKKSTLWCARDTSPGMGRCPPPISPTSAMGWWGGAERPGGDDGGAPPGEAGDAMDAGGFNGFGQGQIGEDRRQASGQPRLPRPGRPQEQDVGVRTPASGSR